MNMIFKNNKKVIFSIVFMLFSVVSLGVFMQSCSNNDDIVDFTIEQKRILEESSFIGKEHNRNMQDVYERLYIKHRLKNTEAIKFTKDNIFQVFKATTETILKENYVGNLDEKYIQTVAEKYFTPKNSQIRIKSNNANNLFDAEMEDKMSEKLSKLIRELINVSENLYLSIREHKIKVDQLNKIAFSSLEHDELTIFLAGSAVACASFEYWHTNINNWFALIHGYERPRLKNGSESPYDHWLLQGMVEADVKGGVEGAIGGAAVGLLTSGGVFSVPDAVLGAIAGSSISSIDQLVINMWKHYF